MDIAKSLDELLEWPVLVVGSLPPAGRDLDLLTRPEHNSALEGLLLAEGFENKGSIWARFEDCSVEVVDLRPVSYWGLPDEEVEALFEEGSPLDGMGHLQRPSPHHTLLILARRVGTRRGPLTDKRLVRIQDALAQDPLAWDEARKRADAWGCRAALCNLAAAYRSGSASRRAALRAPSRKALRALNLKRRFARGVLITFSGIDGSGKTTQIGHLTDILQRLGFDAVRVWNRLAVNPSLDVIGVPAKKLLGLVRGSGAASVGGKGGEKGERGEKKDPLRDLRSRSDLITFGWTLIVALWNGVSQRRTAGAHLRRGRVVLCDRYTLDSSVSLSYLYGEHRSFRWQERLIKALSPRPVLSLFLDVDAQTAHLRKPVKYQVEDLERHVRLYRASSERLGAHRVDGTAPTDEICSQIARLVWHALD